MQLQAAGLWPSQPVYYIEDVFSTWLYTGNDSTQTITNGINLSGKGGLVWTKVRNNSDSHWLVDTVRGANNNIESNSSNQQRTFTGVTGFTSSGYTLQEDSSIQINDSRFNYVSWTFREQPKFFDIVTYTGNDALSRQISHNLGSTPGCIFVKSTSNSQDWFVNHRSLSGPNYTLNLNLTDAQYTSANWGNAGGTYPTSTNFTVGDNANVAGRTYVAYLFAHDAGGFGLTGTDNVISCGSFTTDGGGNATVNLGYEPQWLLLKSSTDNTNNWSIIDNMRGWVADGGANLLDPNRSSAEVVYPSPTYTYWPFNSTGFNAAFTSGNAGKTWIYIAIRRGPMALPTTGTQVYSGVLRTGTGSAANVTGAGFPPDLVISEQRIDPKGDFSDRLRGTTQLLKSSETSAESTDANGITSFSMDGMAVGTGFTANRSGRAYVYWFLRRYPSVFDEVCYTGDGTTNRSVNHNLTVVPEIILVKRRSAGQSWLVWGTPSLGAGNYLILNTTAASANAGTLIPSTSTTFGAQDAFSINDSSVTYVAYLFATCAGVSKVGSYTGNGTTQTIDCGFGAGGARFVLIKRTDSTGDWYVYDTTRGMTVLTDPYLLLNSTAAEAATLGSVTTVSTGFAVNATVLAAINTNAASYIFLAIA
jgi:hypothetical protein